MFEFLAQSPRKTTQQRVRVILPAANGQYLLQKAQASGKYRHAGGGVEPGEALEEAAIRELWEELGVSRAFSKKRLKYLGPDPRPEWGEKEHYYLLDRHSVQPGRYTATNNPKEIVEMEAIAPTADNYWGPDIELLLNRKIDKPADRARLILKKAGFLSSIIGGPKNVDIQSDATPTVGANNPGNERVLAPTGPYFRIVSLGDKGPTKLHGPYDDNDWYTDEEANHPGHEAYWTALGLKKYIDSGTFDKHRANANTDLAVMVADSASPKFDNAHQIVVDPKDVKLRDTYYIDKARTKPLTSNEILARYVKGDQTALIHLLKLYKLRRHGLIHGLVKQGWLPRFLRPREAPIVTPAIESVARAHIPDAAKALPRSGWKPELPKVEAAEAAGAKALGGDVNALREALPQLSQDAVAQSTSRTSRIADQLRYMANMKANEKFWSWGEAGPRYKVPDSVPWYKKPLVPAMYARQYVTSPARQAIAKYVFSNPIRKSYNAMVQPYYPVFEPAMKRLGLGAVPKIMRLGSKGGMLGGMGLTGYSLLYGIPQNFTNELYANGYVDDKGYDRVIDNISGPNALRFYLDLYNPKNANDPLVKAHKDVINESLIPGIRHGLYNARKQMPATMGAIDIGRSMSPFGLATTLLSRAAAKEDPPEVDQAIRKAILKHGPEIVDTPSKAWDSPIRKFYTDKVFTPDTISTRPAIIKQWNDNVVNWMPWNAKIDLAKRLRNSGLDSQTSQNIDRTILHKSWPHIINATDELVEKSTKGLRSVREALDIHDPQIQHALKQVDAYSGEGKMTAKELLKPLIDKIIPELTDEGRDKRKMQRIK